MRLRSLPPRGDDGPRKRSPPLVIPGDEPGYGREGPRWGRRLLVLALVVAGTYGAARLIGAVGGRPADEPIPEAGRPVPAGGTLQAESGGAPSPATPNPSAGGNYRQMADSLATALDQYHQRQLDFHRGIIGCAELATGYGAVDDAFVHLSIAFRFADVRGDSRRQEYRRLAARADTVNRQFDASGCSRPR